MNRQQRRAQRRKGTPVPPAAVSEFAQNYRCPDCAATSELHRDQLGLWHLLVSHDETCPTYRSAP